MDTPTQNLTLLERVDWSDPLDTALNFFARIQGANYASWILLTITLYDWLLMLHREIDNVWRVRPRLRAGTIIYFVNRYFMIASVVLLVAGTTVSVSLEGCVICRAMKSTMSVLLACVRFSQGLFAALRIYAIWEASRPMGATVLGLYVVPLVLSLYEAFRVQVANPSRSDVRGCLRVKEALDIRLAQASDVLMVTADALVLLMTWKKTRAIQQEANRLNLNLRLSLLLARDGSIHFIIQLLLTVVDLILLSEQPTTQLQTGTVYPFLGMVTGANGILQDDYLNPFLVAVQSIVIAHFILSLRQVLLVTEYHDDDLSYDGTGRPPSMFSFSWLGNFGAPLHNHVDSEIVFAPFASSTGSSRPKSSPNPLAYGLPQAGADEEFATLLKDGRALMEEPQNDPELEMDDLHNVDYFFDDSQYGRRLLAAMRRGNTQESSASPHELSEMLSPSPARRGLPLAQTPPLSAAAGVTSSPSRSPSSRLSFVGVHTPVSVYMSEASLCVAQRAEIVQPFPIPSIPDAPPMLMAPRRTATGASSRTVRSEVRKYFGDVEYGKRVLKFIRTSEVIDSNSDSDSDSADQPERLALLSHDA